MTQNIATTTESKKSSSILKGNKELIGEVSQPKTFAFYHQFLKGALNPLRFTTMDKQLIEAELKFNKEVSEYKDVSIISLRLDHEILKSGQGSLESFLNKLALIDLGYEENDEVQITISDEIDHNGIIDVEISPKNRCPVPELKSDKEDYFSKLIVNVDEEICKSIQERALTCKTKESLSIFIKQQYRIGEVLIDKFKKQQKLDKNYLNFSRTLRPLQTNTSIYFSITNSITHVLTYLADHYEEEIMATQIAEASDSESPTPRLKFNLSVPVLTGLFRLLKEVNGIEVKHDRDVMKFITDQCSSKNAPAPTLTSVSKKYYSLDSTTFSDLFALLQNMQTKLKQNKKHYAR